MAKITNRKVNEAYANFRRSKRVQMQNYLDKMNTNEKLPKIFGVVYNPDTEEMEDCLRLKLGQYGIADVFLNGRTKEELLLEMIPLTYKKNNPDGFFQTEFLSIYLDNRMNLSPERETSAKRLSKTELRKKLGVWLDGGKAPQYLTDFLTSEGS